MTEPRATPANKSPAVLARLRVLNALRQQHGIAALTYWRGTLAELNAVIANWQSR